MVSGRNSAVARRPSGGGIGPEIDVTPVMNMFIILIPFLISMAVFTQLATHAFTLPGDDPAGIGRPAATLPLTVAVAVDGVTVILGGHTIASVPASADGDVDAAALLAVLATERARRPDVAAVTVAVDDPVTSAALVRCLDQCRAAGFTEVGLAEAVR